MSGGILVAKEAVAQLRIEPPAQAPSVLVARQVVATLVAVAQQGPSGPAGAAGSGFNFTQSTPSDAWTINHNLGFRPDVAVFTSGGVTVEADVLHVSANQVLVSFSTPLAGQARCS